MVLSFIGRAFDATVSMEENKYLTQTHCQGTCESAEQT